MILVPTRVKLLLCHTFRKRWISKTHIPRTLQTSFVIVFSSLRKRRLGRDIGLRMEQDIKNNMSSENEHIVKLMEQNKELTLALIQLKERVEKLEGRNLYLMNKESGAGNNDTLELGQHRFFFLYDSCIC